METVVWSKPENQRAGTPLLVMMHGYGTDEVRMSDLFGLLPPDFTCAALRAPKVIGDDYGWFLLDYFLANDFAKADDAKQLLRIGVQELGALGHAYTLPPKARKNLVDILRKAFEETMKDSEFLAEADKSGIVTNPVPGKELEEIVSGFVKLPADLLARLKSSLLPKQ